MNLPGEWICLLTVLLQTAAGIGMLRRREFPVTQYGQILVAGFVAEEICVRWLGVYQYSDRWVIYIDRVPLAVVLTWPWIILTAAGLVRHARPTPHAWADAIAVGAIVSLDALIVEPLAVHAGLWTWRLPGGFGVPAIGLLGWGVFAGCCVATMRRTGYWILRGSAAAMAAVLLLGGAWWTLFRWLPPAAGLVLAVLLPLLVAIIHFTQRRTTTNAMAAQASRLRISGLACLLFSVLTGPPLSA